MHDKRAALMWSACTVILYTLPAIASEGALQGASSLDKGLII